MSIKSGIEAANEVAKWRGQNRSSMPLIRAYTEGEHWVVEVGRNGDDFPAGTFLVNKKTKKVQQE